jgi:phosphoribosylformylglycinamidine cyclo-ligase
VDCIAIDHLDPDEATEIVAGVADACVEAGCELVGGETAQLPGLLTTGSYEVMGTCVGIVEYDRAWGPHRVLPGDALVGLAASGLHSNGYSLVRRLLEESGEEPSEDLLVPTSIYARKLLAMAGTVEVHAVAHVTGGGLAGNVSRILPEGTGAAIEIGRWPRPGIYEWLASRLDEEEMRATFNLGIGMVVATPDGAAAVDALAALDVEAWVIGEVDAGSGVRLA